MMKTFFFSITTLLCALAVRAQDPKALKLKQEHMAFAPKGFYIFDVVDDRTDKNTIGQMTEGGKKSPLNFQNGAAAALKGYIANNVTQDKSTQGMIIHITKANYTMKKSTNQWHEDADVTLTFYVAGRNLVEYSITGQKDTNGDPLDFVDEFMRRVTEKALKNFEEWWAHNKEKIPLSQTVKVNATIGKTTTRPNCIAYSTQRPLQIVDFTGKVESNIAEMAATLSGIGFESSGLTEHGQLVINVTITPYFNKALSWFRQEGKNKNVLAHEQAHFDITAIKACELVAKIRSTTFMKDTYEFQLTELMNKNMEATNKEEAVYDDETNHGIIKDKQLEWEKKTKDRLKEVGCY